MIMIRCTAALRLLSLPGCHGSLRACDLDWPVNLRLPLNHGPYHSFAVIRVHWGLGDRDGSRLKLAPQNEILEQQSVKSSHRHADQLPKESDTSPLRQSSHARIVLVYPANHFID